MEVLFVLVLTKLRFHGSIWFKVLIPLLSEKEGGLKAGSYTMLIISGSCIHLPPPPTGTPPSRRRRIV